MAWCGSVISRTRKFIAVDRHTKALLVLALLFLWLTRLGLWIASLRNVQSLLKRFARRRREASALSAGQIVELVSRCADYVPKADCLPQALIAEVLLRREGYQPTLKIGVARGENGEFQAHAWVEVQGESFGSGNETIGRFTALPAAFG